MKKIDILSNMKTFRATFIAVILFVFGSGVLMAQTAISGNVFEDVNYGGAAGRSKASSSGVGVQYADVELYNSNGEYMSGTNTDENGDYSITGLAAGTYYVRVVTDSVRSSRTGWTTNCKPVMTYRTNAASGTAVAVTDFVGGTNPSANDPGVGSSGATFNTSTFEYSTVLSGTAQAVTQCILTSSDITGVNFGFNYNTIVNTNNSSQGSLRQVITNMNTLGDDANLLQSGLVVAKDNAVFMISDGTSTPGLRSANNYFSGGIATISPTSAFPTISSTLVLDAQKQPSWTSTPVIELNGTNAGLGAKGLELTGGSSIVRGFIINRFTGNSSSAGIWISTNGSNTIQGNYIGTNSAGNSASANYQGIYISGTTGNFIGGTSMTQRNVLSGNTWRGIGLYAGTSGNTVRGNYVGVNAAGTTAIPNNIGISVWSSPNNTIGGSLIGEGNVLSGNLNFGVYFVSSAASGNTVQGNIIGLNATQSGSVPNGSSGIELYGPGDGGSNNIIGGTGAGNVISGNGGVGIKLRGGSGNLILQNSIYANNGIGIDLNADSISLNNGTKNSTLPNYEMDFPVFSSAKLNGTTLTFEGYVGSSPSQSTFANAIVEIFKSDNDLPGYGEGQTYLGRDTCDANGNFSGSFIVTGLTVGDKITGTAIDGSNNTSEFGANFNVIMDVTPVELVSFDASVKGKSVQLYWKTATEVNNYGFEIERSSNNETFSRHSFVRGSGNSNSDKHYSFTDNNLQNGTYYYRLKQLDTDGQFSYSDVVKATIDYTPNSFALSQNYPNPFNPSTKISWQSPVSGWQTLKVYDILGNEVATLVNEFREAGSYEIEFSAKAICSANASRLQAGFIFTKLVRETFPTQRK